MFNFQGSELMIILLLALVVLGPEKLPEAMRKLGRFYADLKKMSSGFQEEFRAAVDEPTRELRETANTIRDSLDFRKLQDGQRPEKPKSAEMSNADPSAGLAPADADAVPTDDVPFRDDTGTDDDTDTDDTGTDDTGTAAAASARPRRRTAFTEQTSTPPPPPAPFSSSQSISAAAPAPRTSDDAVPATGSPSNGAVPPTRTPQVAVDDEHGLREARPADQDGAA